MVGTAVACVDVTRRFTAREFRRGDEGARTPVTREESEDFAEIMLGSRESAVVVASHWPARRNEVGVARVSESDRRRDTFQFFLSSHLRERGVVGAKARGLGLTKSCRRLGLTERAGLSEPARRLPETARRAKGAGLSKTTRRLSKTSRARLLSESAGCLLLSKTASDGLLLSESTGRLSETAESGGSAKASCV